MYVFTKRCSCKVSPFLSCATCLNNELIQVIVTCFHVCLMFLALRCDARQQVRDRKRSASSILPLQPISVQSHCLTALSEARATAVQKNADTAMNHFISKKINYTDPHSEVRVATTHCTPASRAAWPLGKSFVNWH